MQTNNDPKFAALLETALTEPGRVSTAFRAFHGYSLGNQILAMFQCMARDISIGPIASFNGWKEHGRHVKKGEKAIELCMPITSARSAKRPPKRRGPSWPIWRRS